MNSVRAVPFLSTFLSGSRTRPRRFSSLGRSQDLPPTLDNAQHDAGGRGGQCEPRPLSGSQGTERLAVGDLGGGCFPFGYEVSLLEYRRAIYC